MLILTIWGGLIKMDTVLVDGIITCILWKNDITSVNDDLVHWRINLYYDDVIMSTIASQITSLTIVCSIVYSDTNQRNHQSSASLAFVWGIHRGPVNSPHKWPVTRKMFPFADVIMLYYASIYEWDNSFQPLREKWNHNSSDFQKQI